MWKKCAPKSLLLNGDCPWRSNFATPIWMIAQDTESR
jgi:hypothetical protein